MAVEAMWFSRSAMLMPLERMRVGISSDRASHTHTPGPTAKKPMKANRAAAVSQPWRADGTGVMRAWSICSGAVRAAARSAKGLRKKPTTAFGGTQLARETTSPAAAGSSERTAFVADWNPP